MRTLLLLPALLAGCAAPPPSPEPAPRPPPDPLVACRTDLSGAWVHAEDEGFRYFGRDDGGALVLEVSRAAGDAGPEPSAELVFVRSSGGFVGAVGIGRPSADGGCVALFPAEVVSCADGGLWVSTIGRLRVDGACRPQGPTGERRTHHLVRPAPDGGR